MKTTRSLVPIFLLLCAPGGACFPSESFERHLPEAYTPAKEVEVLLGVDSPCFYFEIFENLPRGWSILSSDPPLTGFDETSGAAFWLVDIEVTFWWPWEIKYTVMPPPEPAGQVSFDGRVRYATSKGEPLLEAPITGETVIDQSAGGALRYRPHWATIQHMVDTSEWGDTIMVSGADPLAPENVVMKAGVNLVGFAEWPDYSVPVIEAKDPTQPAIVAAPYTRISGFIIRSSSVGIQVNDPTVEISNCVIIGTERAAIEYVGTDRGKVTNCTIVNNAGGGIVCSTPSPEVVVSNCILFGNAGNDVENCTARFCLLEDEIEPGSGENNISGDPMLLNPATGDYRLQPNSACIDAGDNSAVAQGAVDILGKPRIMFGGRSETVDIGACEYWFVSAMREPGTADLQLRWVSRPEKTYSVFFSDNLIDWELADDSVSSAGTITLWVDPVGWPPVVLKRFYRVTENE